MYVRIINYMIMLSFIRLWVPTKVELYDTIDITRYCYTTEVVSVSLKALISYVGIDYANDLCFESHFDRFVSNLSHRICY